jgi:23S rRNA (guanosine2251-2'-O)-methyltransferase
MAYERKPPRGGTGGGKKPFGKKPGGFKKDFGDKPKRSFGDRDDRPKRDFGDRPKRASRDGDDRPKRSFGDKPKRSFGDRDDRPKRDFGDKPKRSFRDDGDRPKRDFGDRPPRRDGDDRPKRDFGDKPRRSFGDRDDRPKRDFSDRPKRDFGDRPPRRDGDDRPRRSFDGDRPKRDFGDKPRRSFGDRDDRPKRDFGDRPKRDFGDKPRRSFSDRDDRPKRDFGDRPKRDFGDRPPRREYSDRKPRFERREEGGADREGHELVLFGVHAVQAALRNEKRKVKVIWATENGLERVQEAFDATRHPEVQMVEKRDIERKLPEGAVHQGIAIAVENLDEVFLTDVLAAAQLESEQRHVVVILDEVSDPHNVGAVLRSMSVFGAKALVVHKHNAPSVTGTMAKIATGAMEFVPMIPVVNIAGAMNELKKAGFFVLGLDENADYPLSGAPSDGHIALVMGAEGEGLRALTRTTCDAIASIPTFGDLKSLNVSNAAAIALYTVTSKA